MPWRDLGRRDQRHAVYESPLSRFNDRPELHRDGWIGSRRPSAQANSGTRSTHTFDHIASATCRPTVHNDSTAELGLLHDSSSIKKPAAALVPRPVVWR